jgi:hypothetical protein
VGDQHGRTILLRQFTACRGVGIGKCCQRILHGRDFQAGSLKQRDDLSPAGAVRPGSVHQYDIFCFNRRGRLGARLNSAERCRSDGERIEKPN